jgi:hypothetical protein
VSASLPNKLPCECAYVIVYPDTRKILRYDLPAKRVDFTEAGRLDATRPPGGEGEPSDAGERVQHLKH